MGDEQASAGDAAHARRSSIRPVVASGDAERVDAAPLGRCRRCPAPLMPSSPPSTARRGRRRRCLRLSTRSTLEVDGIVDGQRLTRRDLSTLTLRVTSAGAGPDDVRVEVNGDVVPVTADGDGLVVGAEALARESSSRGPTSWSCRNRAGSASAGRAVERTFTFDPVGPLLMVPAAVLAPTPERPTVLRGLVDGAVSLTANGQPVTIEPGGAFTVPVALGRRQPWRSWRPTPRATPPTATVVVTADAAGGRTIPRPSAVHVTARSWADPAVREPILELARSGLINAVQLDIKDESGEVGYASTVPLAMTTGAAIGPLRRRGGARRAARVSACV